MSSPLGTTYGARLSAYLTTYEDFRKHRRRTNKTLLKLRHDLGLVTRDTRNYQDKEKTSAISAAEYDSDDRYGLLLLLLAERDSLYALEIKSLLEISGEKMASYKKLMVSKLKRAVGTCQKLLAVAANEAKPIRKIEFYVYSALTTGTYALNKKQWTRALHAFSVARCGLELLSAQTEDESFSKTLIDELLDTVVDPSLKLAVSQNETNVETTSDLRTIARKHCHDGSVPHLSPAVDLVSLVDLSFVLEPQEEELSKTVTWRNHEAQIYNDELAYKIATLNKANWREYTDLNEYDSVLSKWSALVDIHTTDLQKNKDEDDMEKVQDGAVLLTYLKYNSLFTKLKRDLLLIDQRDTQGSSVAKKLHTNRDVVRLYTSVVSTVEELKDLPGVYNDEDLYESLDNMARFFTVKRSVAVADSYALANKFPEALKIYSHLQRTFGAGDLYKIEEFPYDAASNGQARQLSEMIAGRLQKVHTLTQFYKELETSQGFDALVIDNVHRFPLSADSVNHITNVGQKGKIAPVLSKAVLFDVAFNYISYSGSEAKTPETETEDKKKSGFFGIFGR